MRLVVDASTLVAEALRVRGRELLGHPSLDLLVTADAWGETQHELRRRTAIMASRGLLTAEDRIDLLAEAFASIQSDCTVVPDDGYSAALVEARRRIPRDPLDAPTVALALTLDCGILTGDHDFFGCGVPVWTVETLRLHLEAPSAEPRELTADDEPSPADEWGRSDSG